MSDQPTSPGVPYTTEIAKVRHTLAEQFAEESPQWGLKSEEWEKRITCQNPKCSRYTLEECMIPSNDSNLYASGVKVCARTKVLEKSEEPPSERWGGVRQVHNEIVFRGPAEKITPPESSFGGMPHFPSFEMKQEGVVSCIHTAVSTLDTCEIPSEEMIEKTFTTEGKPVILAPQEHFMALRSTVQGWTEMGWGNALRARYEGMDPEELPFGMNAAMHQQVIGAIAMVAPQAVCDLLAGIFQEVEQFTPQQRLDRWDIYKDRYFTHRTDILQRCPELTELLFELFVGFEPIPRDIGNLTDEKRNDVRRDILNMGTLTPALWEHFILDPDPYFRVNLAGRSDAPESILKRLSQDKEFLVRKAAMLKISQVRDNIQAMPFGTRFLIAYPARFQLKDVVRELFGTDFNSFQWRVVTIQESLGRIYLEIAPLSEEFPPYEGTFTVADFIKSLVQTPSPGGRI